MIWISTVIVILYNDNIMIYNTYIYIYMIPWCQLGMLTMAVDPTLNQMFQDLKYLIFLRFCVLVLVDLLQNLDSWMIWSRIWFRREQDEEVLFRSPASLPWFFLMFFFVSGAPVKNPWRAEPLWRDCQVATKGRIHSCGGLRAGSLTHSKELLCGPAVLH